MTTGMFYFQLISRSHLLFDASSLHFHRQEQEFMPVLEGTRLSSLSGKGTEGDATSGKYISDWRGFPPYVKSQIAAQLVR